MAAIKLFVWHRDDGSVAAAMATSVQSARKKLTENACPDTILAEVREREPDSVQAFREAVVWSAGRD